MCNKHQPEAFTGHQHSDATLVARTFDSILAATAAHTPSRQANKVVLTPLPFFDSGTHASSLSVAFIALIPATDGAGFVTSVLSYDKSATGEDNFRAFCLDKFSQGLLSAEQRDERIQQVVAQVSPLCRDEVSTDLHALYGSYKVAARNCGFWQAQRRDPSYVCEDTSILLAKVTEVFPGKSAYELLKTEFERLVGGTGGARAGTKEFDPFESFAFNIPILSVGESGSGKTLGALKFAQANDLHLVKLSCEAGTTGADITGYYMKAPGGDVVWVDGKMTAAFRLAAKGEKKVMLLVDEMLRVDVRELAIFLSAFELNPLTKKYELSTGRILRVEDGLAVLEHLSVDPRFLCIVATTNIGGKYAVGDMDKALQDRFVMIRVDIDEEGIVEAARSQLKESHMPEELAEKCGKFWTAMTRAKKNSEVNETPSKRLINRAIFLSPSPAMVTVVLKTFVPHWVGLDSDGFPLTEQVKKVESIIDTAFA